MYSIIVVPPKHAATHDHIHLTSGERLPFGSARTPGGLTIPHPGVLPRAGEITANGTYWLLSNLSDDHTYVVENPEGAGEHVKIAPGRVEAPVPFEFGRLVLLAGGDLIPIDVWAPRHTFRSAARHGLTSSPTAPAFSLDRTKRYFAVLVALCEPRLRGAPHAPLPAVEELVERLRPTWPTVSRTAVHWNIDYLALKLRLRPDHDPLESARPHHGRRESLVSLALRFNLAREDDLSVLTEYCAGPR
ncbi:FHA domain-containing protein [Streptomyces sp. NPDC006997]|uniref:FHA domain-containing protein n=1 Tax=Streptomyces sp. NPDC006997 TaxID=3155356 RepID=UPI0033CB4806